MAGLVGDPSRGSAEPRNSFGNTPVEALQSRRWTRVRFPAPPLCAGLYRFSRIVSAGDTAVIVFGAGLLLAVGRVVVDGMARYDTVVEPRHAPQPAQGDRAQLS